MVLGRKTTEVNCPSHHIISSLPATNVTYTDDIGLHHLVTEVFVRLHYEAAFPAFSILVETGH